jgi:hypothetical protein
MTSALKYAHGIMDFVVLKASIKDNDVNI